MKHQFNKFFFISLALIAGVLVVLFTWKSSVHVSNELSFNPTISGDSWKDSLSAVPRSPSLKVASELVALSTTTTDVIARDLLVNYMLLQQSRATTTLSDTDIESLSQMLVAKLAPTKGTQYTKEDLNLSSDNQPEAVALYAKLVGEALRTFSSSQTKSDLEIILTDPSINGEQRLADIAQNIARYEKLKKTLLALKTPSEASSLHLQMVQSYSNMENDIKLLIDIYKDPMKGLGAMAQYREEVSKITILAEKYRAYTSKIK